MDTNKKNYYVVVFGNPYGSNKKYISECLLVETKYGDRNIEYKVRSIASKLLKEGIKHPNMGSVLEFFDWYNPALHAVAGKSRSIDYIKADIEKNCGANVFRVYDYRLIELPRIRQY